MLNFFAEIETKKSLFPFPVNSNNNWYYNDPAYLEEHH